MECAMIAPDECWSHLTNPAIKEKWARQETKTETDHSKKNRSL